jgi:hypothetical protein
MLTTRKNVAAVGVLVGLAVGVVLGAGLARPLLGAYEQEPAAAAAPRHTVVFTEGHNLCVADNKLDTLYFYTVDAGDEPGSDLKLRATLDMSQVGKDVLHPKLLRKKK